MFKTNRVMLLAVIDDLRRDNEALRADLKQLVNALARSSSLSVPFQNRSEAVLTRKSMYDLEKEMERKYAKP